MLQLKVTSPRIMFFQSLKAMRGMMKTIIVFLVLVVGGWFGYQAIDDHFLKNDEFALKHLKISNFEGGDTRVLPRERIVEISEIDENGTIFAMDLDEVKQALLDRPEIVDVEVKRKMPDTIEVRVKERVPVAWLSCRQLGLAGRNPYRGVLLDQDGMSFKCEKGFWKVAKDLPVIEFATSADYAFRLGSKFQHERAERALSFVKLMSELKTDASWEVERIKVVNFYKLEVVCTDDVVGTFGMHDHDRQIKQFFMAREHAKSLGRELEWIDLIPKKNAPGGFKEIAGRER